MKPFLITFLVALGFLGKTVLGFKFRSLNSTRGYFVQCETSNSNCQLIDKATTKTAPRFSHCHGLYLDEVSKDGWGKLWVHGDDTLDAWFQCGYLEGFATADRIYQHFTSWYSHQFPSGADESTLKFINDQFNYAISLSRAEGHDPYLATLASVMAQNQGLYQGMVDASIDGEVLTMEQLLLLQAAGDLYDIIPATNRAKFQLDVGKVSKEEFETRWHNSVSCTGLIKITDDLQDVFVGHTTWTSYTNMLRIYKNYDLAGGRYQSSFSAKPGVIYSKDDFYVLPRDEQRMVVLETTNGIMNSELYDLIVPTTLLTWQRMPIAHTLATSGREWTSIFARHQSGTYCNQYMVVDFKQFVPGKGAKSKDFLWIIEVIPGYTEALDVTNVLLSQGNYWPSVNIPFFKSVYIVSGYQTAYETYGNSYSYDNSSRALMLRRDHSSVQSLDSMMKIMRQNNYKTDPYANGDPYSAISSRKDLRSTNAALTGGIDSKIASFSMMESAKGSQKGVFSVAQSGPTHETQDLPPFSWSESGSTEVHLGQPDVFNFGFVDMDFFAY